MKLNIWWYLTQQTLVALRGRAWIEIVCSSQKDYIVRVALRGRAWIEIDMSTPLTLTLTVALRGRAWIEIHAYDIRFRRCEGRPPREGVD